MGFTFILIGNANEIKRFVEMIKNSKIKYKNKDLFSIGKDCFSIFLDRSVGILYICHKV